MIESTATGDGLGSPGGALACSGGTRPRDDAWPRGDAGPWDPGISYLPRASSVTRVIMLMQVANLERY